jgi:hypothetical protein
MFFVADGVMMDGIRLPLEVNEMLLYVDPSAAPAECPLDEPEGPPMSERTLFD